MKRTRETAVLTGPYEINGDKLNNIQEIYQE
jgi:hypothetical protein